MFGLNFLIGLGTGLGLILLVIPGLIIWVRTNFASCHLIDGSTIWGSIEEGMAATKGHFWRISGYFIAMGVMLSLPQVGAFVLSAIVSPEGGFHWSIDSLTEFVFGLPLVFLIPFEYAFYMAVLNRRTE